MMYGLKALFSMTRRVQSGPAAQGNDQKAPMAVLEQEQLSKVFGGDSEDSPKGSWKAA